AAAGMGAASVLVSVGYDFPNARWILRHHPTIPSPVGSSWPRLIALVRHAFPLGLMAVLGSLYQNIPRFFIERYQGIQAVGYYSAVFYLTYAGYTVIAAMGNATSPRLAVSYLESPRKFARTVTGLTLLGGGIGVTGTIVSLLAGHWVLSVLYRPEYSQYQALLVWIMISSTLWYMATLLVFAAIAAKRFASQAYLHGLAAATTLAFCPLLIPRLGILGAAVALTSGVAVLFVAELVVVRSAIRHWRPGGRADLPVGFAPALSTIDPASIE
ncbi:MAG: oligosaccharide flippase family protein, partial [Gemmatimonadota bacterium]